VITGHGEVVQGGGRDLLTRLGRVYVAPDFEFAPTEGEGYVLRTTIEKVSGVGPWAQAHRAHHQSVTRLANTAEAGQPSSVTTISPSRTTAG
jgi:hypothetical protein